MAIIKNNINFGNQNIKRIYKGSNQITQIWKKVNNQNKLLYYYGDGSQGLTYSDISVWKATVTNLGAQYPQHVTFDVTDYIPNPWSEVEFNGDIFIKFPKMYRKILAVTDNQITSFSISNTKLDDDYELYPCFIDEGGNELEYILVGKYVSNSSDTCNSVAEWDSVTQTISNGRIKARARGSGYQLMDWRIQRLWQDLLICAMKTVNTNSGSGITTDVLGLYWGDADQWVDGFCHTNTTWIYSNSPSKYIDSPTANSDSYAAISGYTIPSTILAAPQIIQKLGYDSIEKFFNYPSAYLGDSAYTRNTYYCNTISLSSTTLASPINTIVGKVGGGGVHGAFNCNVKNYWDINKHVRLCYRPTATSKRGETEMDSSMPKLTATGITEVEVPISPLNIPERTFEFDDQNKIGTVVAVSTGAFKDAADSKIAGKVQIPSTVETIGDNAFMNCSGITSVTMKTPYVDIGKDAFSGDTSLSSFIIEDETSDSQTKYFNIGDRAFYGCPLKVVYIGRRVNSIGEDAFSTTITDQRNVFIDDIYDFCKIDFANQYANPLNKTFLMASLFKTDYHHTYTEITSISTNDLYSSSGIVTLPVLFQKCAKIISIEINSGHDISRVVYTQGSLSNTAWRMPTLNIFSCAVGSYFDAGVFSASFETVKIYFASTWTAYDGDTIVATISPTGPTGTNWNTFFNNNAAYKIKRTQ